MKNSIIIILCIVAVLNSYAQEYKYDDKFMEICYAEDRKDTCAIDSLDSLIMNEQAPQIYWHYSSTLERCKGKPKYYGHFSKMYADNCLMLKYLAAYHNPQVLEKINEALVDFTNYHFNIKKRKAPYRYVALEAIAEFPDSSFIPYLEKTSKKVYNRKKFPWHCIPDFFAAVMAYDNEWAYQLIETCLKKNAKCPRDYKDLARGYFMANKKERFKPFIDKYCDEEMLQTAMVYGSEHRYIKRPWYVFWKKRFVEY